MAYSDYGGFCYRNGKRVTERSDATISPDGDVFGSPGMWPGIAGFLAGGKDEAERRKGWPSGHVVLGDGPIFVSLYKQTSTGVYRFNEQISLLDIAKELPEGSVWTSGDGEFKMVDTDFYVSNEMPYVAEFDGYKLEVYYLSEDNYYQYARLTQPDGNVWHGWSGYGVGAGFEDDDYGYSCAARDEKLKSLWPESITESEATQ